MSANPKVTPEEASKNYIALNRTKWDERAPEVIDASP